MPDNSELHLPRALAQHLQALRRAGVTHLPRDPERAARQAPVRDTAAAARRSPPGLPIEDAASVAGGNGEFRSGTVRTAESAPAAAIGTNATAMTEPPTERTQLSLEDRRARLAEVAGRVADCSRCAELARCRTQTVFGVGDPQARLLFIGEAPGADEDRQGEPFVGKAGQLLNRIVAACGLKREDVYICNVLKCRPPGNRTPSPEEAQNCREFLDAQIATVDPDYIVCWGACAAGNLLATKAPIGKMRKKFFRHGRARVLCTYHPSYLLRNPAAKKDVWEDMKFLMRDMGVDLDANPPAR